jgi:hypothetical protein
MDEECPMPNDYDRDGDTDLLDFAAFQLCQGPAPDDACQCAFDYGLTDDDVVDLADFAKLTEQLSAAGPAHICWIAIQQARYAELCAPPSR